MSAHPTTALLAYAPAAPLPPGLPASLVAVATKLLAPGRPVRAFTPGELAEDLDEVISAAAITMGLSNTAKDGRDLAVITEQVALLVLEAFPSLKPGEVHEAIGRGARGNYPSPPDATGRPGFEAFGVPMFRRWLGCYVAAERWQAVVALRAAEEAAEADARAAAQRPLTTEERVELAAQVLTLPPADAEAHLLAVLACEWCWKWGLLADFHPDGYADARTWWQQLETAAAERIRQELAREDPLKRGGEVSTLNAALRGQEVADPSDLRARIKAGQRRAIIRAYAAHLSDLSPVAVRALLTVAAATPTTSAQ